MTSYKKNSPAAYGDVKTLMDLAVEKPGLQYICKTHGAAINFKQRCNHYRNLLREMAAEQTMLIPGYRAETAYDVLVIRQVDAEGNPSRKGAILIFDHQEPAGQIIDPETGLEIIITPDTVSQGGL
jgi:hypothetical protein